jgi:uncharacterized surface protein with fasciclin (FAS1) repeats
MRNVLFFLCVTVVAAGGCGGSAADEPDTTATSGGEGSMGTDGSDDMATGGTEAMANIVETAQQAGNFETLLTAAQAAGLADTLANDGPFTVFAPTDEAFAALPDGTLDELLKPENQDQLKSILLYHVVSGEVGSSEVVTMTAAPTLEGSELPIDASGGSVMVGEATVVTPDIAASNGTIHVIDKVLMPGS